MAVIYRSGATCQASIGTKFRSMACHISFRSVSFVPAATTVTITVTTNVPCHLFCRLSKEPPRIHKKSVMRRGEAFMSELRFCFTVYEDNEQVEAGDTLEHTWVKPAWPFCTTKYFYLWGSISGVTCVSTSPPFHYHNSYIYVPPVETSDKYDINWRVFHFAQYWNAHGGIFEPVHDYTAKRISLITTPYSADRKGPYIVKLTAVGGSCWEEEVLWSHAGYSTDLPPPGDYSWTDYEPVDIPLTAGVQYRIVIHTTPGWLAWSAGAWIPWEAGAALSSRCDSLLPLYPRGNKCAGCNFRDSSSIWTNTLTQDLCFKVWE